MSTVAIVFDLSAWLPTMQWLLLLLLVLLTNIAVASIAWFLVDLFF
jgi:hypothetical protein